MKLVHLHNADSESRKLPQLQIIPLKCAFNFARIPPCSPARVNLGSAVTFDGDMNQETKPDFWVIELTSEVTG